MPMGNNGSNDSIPMKKKLSLDGLKQVLFAGDDGLLEFPKTRRIDS